ncbi:MAG: long-chain fatty acid--CoA ligase [Candidatus Omnitrophica bacterium]|nr:long-chain fatty acid--CoA ligase [Candidatus Omnitrophota bacterium]
MNLVRLLEESANKFSWRKCIISENAVLSFRALNKKVNQLAYGLKENLQVQEGDKVAVLLGNCPEFIIALFAILKLKAVCIPINVFLTFNEIKYILKDSRAKLLISSSDFLEILENTIKEKQEGSEDLLYLKHIILTDKKKEEFLYWPEVIIQNGLKSFSSEINPQDLALLLYTSGTTGFPKGVMLSHGNLCSNVLSSLQALELNSRDRILLILPMFHTFTLTVCILIPIYIGARIIVIKSVKPFHRVLRSIFLNRITTIVGIPHLYDIFKNLDIPPILNVLLRVRVCISGAAPLSPHTLEAFKQKFKKFVLLEGYGLTETSPVVSINPLNGVQKPGSIGLPVPGVEVKVVREDEGEAQVDEVGELIVKGPNVMIGYYNNPEETKKTIKNGWLFTGDMAKIDDEGYIYIKGRKKEMILMHGMNVYPSEIENALKEHPKINEVAVVGKQDKSKGEIAIAFIVLKEDVHAQESEFIDYCKGRLANYKIPHLIEFRKSLPRTPTGKILKRQLKEEIS